MEHLNAWLLFDFSPLSAAQITTFFNIKEGSTEFNAQPRRRQLILLAYYQAFPHRVYKSKLNAKKYLAYVHFPKTLADEIRALVGTSDYVSLGGLSLKSLSTAIHEEYLTGVGQGRVILDADEVGYDKDKNYPYFNVFAGVTC